MATEQSTTSRSTVAIIGAGPVGLFTALILAKAGIDVAVFDSANDILTAPRAMIYLGVVLDEFKKVGLYDDLLEAGYKNEIGISFRRPGGELLGKISGMPGRPVIHLGQHDAARIILQHLQRYENARVQFQTRFLDFEQDNESVTATLENGPDKACFKHVSQYLVGADGGKSTVRRVAGIPLEGFTWNDFNIVAANIEYDVAGLGWEPGNFIVDDTYWAVIGRLGKGASWRVASGEPVTGDVDDDWDEEKGICQLRERLSKIFPGKTEGVQVTSISPYRVHQRCVSKFSDGRVVLAGDAAHLTNPTGGLGLTTGFLDAAYLGHVLKRIIKDK